jgi:ABC-type multidrug transport system fused ATPase/permease subunit
VDNPIAFVVADRCVQNNTLPLDAAQQVDPILRRCKFSASDARTMLFPAVARDSSNLVEVEDDSTSVCAGRARDTGTAPAQAADKHANAVAAQTDSAEGNCLEVHALGLRLPNGRQLLSDVLVSPRAGSLTAIIGPSGAGRFDVGQMGGRGRGAERRRGVFRRT